MNTLHALDQALATLDSIRALGGCAFGVQETTKDGRRKWTKTKPGVVAPCACGCGKMAKPGTKYASHTCQKRCSQKRVDVTPPPAPVTGPKPSSCAVCPVAKLKPGEGSVCHHPCRPMSIHYLGVPGLVLRARGLCPWGRT